VESAVLNKVHRKKIPKIPLFKFMQDEKLGLVMKKLKRKTDSDS